MNIRFDDNYDSYKGFFDHEWITELSKKVEGSLLDNSVFELATSWKGISSARLLPWLIIESLENLLVSYSSVRMPIPLEVINKFVNRLSNNLERNKTILVSHDKEALIKELVNVQDELISKLNEREKGSIKKVIWENVIEIPDFVFSLWMSKINAYSSIYFAYEIFLINSMKSISNVSNLRTDKLPRELKEYFSKDLAYTCWFEKDIELPRLIRHAIVHNGRKITQDLQKYESELVLEEEEIVIFPYHTTNLFNTLKTKANQFCIEYLNK